MKKCSYYVGCYGFGGDGSYKQMRVITKLNNGTPLFEKDVNPLAFTSNEADKLMRDLIGRGWVAVTLRVPYDRPFMCQN